MGYITNQWQAVDGHKSSTHSPQEAGIRVESIDVGEGSVWEKQRDLRVRVIATSRGGYRDGDVQRVYFTSEEVAKALPILLGTLDQNTLMTVLEEFFTQRRAQKNG